MPDLVEIVERLNDESKRQRSDYTNVYDEKAIVKYTIVMLIDFIDQPKLGSYYTNTRRYSEIDQVC